MRISTAPVHPTPSQTPNVTSSPPSDETRQIEQRYARRTGSVQSDLYSPLQPDVQHTLIERQQAIAHGLRARFGTDPGGLRLVEVGCGAGGNLLEFLRLGLRPEHLTGLELLPERHEAARQVLPASVDLRLGDACAAPIADDSCDLVYQATVFSSLLDNGFQQRLADTMWRWLKPGGSVLWYDFTVNNPSNRDVRGVPLRRVRELFPHARLSARRVTLAPPIARRACAVHPGLYPLLNTLPLLRTHVLVWLDKV